MDNDHENLPALIPCTSLTRKPKIDVKRILKGHEFQERNGWCVCKNCGFKCRLDDPHFRCEPT